MSTVAEEIIVSARRRMGQGAENWADYLRSLALDGLGLAEVRTMDGLLNLLVDSDEESLHLLWAATTTSEDLADALAKLPRIDPAREYYQIAENLSAGVVLPQTALPLRFLGCDVSDGGISALLNCGPLTGPLAPFKKKLNRFGLLSAGDAEAFLALLPETWGKDDPHAHGAVFALYEVDAAWV